MLVAPPPLPAFTWSIREYLFCHASADCWRRIAALLGFRCCFTPKRKIIKVRCSNSATKPVFMYPWPCLARNECMFVHALGLVAIQVKTCTTCISRWWPWVHKTGWEPMMELEPPYCCGKGHAIWVHHELGFCSMHLIRNPQSFSGSLVGHSAPPEFLQLLTYVAYNHHPKIRRLDTIRAYMLGGSYFVEVSLSHSWFGSRSEFSCINSLTFKTNYHFDSTHLSCWPGGHRTTRRHVVARSTQHWRNTSK